MPEGRPQADDERERCVEVLRDLFARLSEPPQEVVDAARAAFTDRATACRQRGARAARCSSRTPCGPVG